MLKYTLVSYLILSIVMLYFANKMLEVKDQVQEKVLGSYLKQIEAINEIESGNYEADSQTENIESYSEALKTLEEIQ